MIYITMTQLKGNPKGRPTRIVCYTNMTINQLKTKLEQQTDFTERTIERITNKMRDGKQHKISVFGAFFELQPRVELSGTDFKNAYIC